MSGLSRRRFCGVLGSTVALPLVGATGEPERAPVGIGISSYAIRGQVERDRGFADPLRFLEFCHARGASGVQVPIGAPGEEATRQLRARVEELGMYLEGSLRTPRDEADVERFDAEVRAAREAGAEVVRTVMQPGRRYEVFDRAGAYRDFRAWSSRSLRLAEPILRRRGVVLAVENHKDFRHGELAELISGLDGERIGVCVDLGNNLALLDDPAETVRTLAPWARSCHLKDMDVEPYDEGFLLSEVPLGRGLLDLPSLVGELRRSNPRLRLSLEMITRDPLEIPCLTDRYWATLCDVPGRDLARALSRARRRVGVELPRVSDRPLPDRLELEESNVLACLRYARDHLI